MRRRIHTTLLLSGVTLASTMLGGVGAFAQNTAPPAAPAAPAAPAPVKVSADEFAANAAAADRLAQLAQGALAGKQIVPATLRQRAALLEAACRLNPTEPRFLRLLTEAYLQIGGEDGRSGATNALFRYITLVPGDQVAQSQMLDLLYSAKDAADERQQFVDKAIASEQLSAEVRSHA